MTKTKLIVRIVVLAIMAILFAGIIVADVFANRYFDLITEYLHGSGMADSFRSEEMQSTLAANDELVREMESEGIVLLRNENVDGKPALPLTKDEAKKINVFGWGGSDGGWVNGSDGSVYASGGQNMARSQKLTKALTEAGIEYNTELMDMYTNYRDKRATFRGLWDPTKNTTNNFFMFVEPGEEYYNATGENGKTVLENADEFSDVSIVVIARLGGEGCDLPHYQTKNTTGKLDDTQPLPVDDSRTYLELTTEEETVLRLARSISKKMIVIYNGCNNMEMSYVEDFGADACISVGGTGQSGVHAIPDVLLGDINPSGKTTATHPYDIKTDPTFVNAGTIASKGDQTYAESIYVGYRWYETADAEGYWDNVDNEYGQGYDGVVQYPFGYGLSYTTFSWEIVEQSLAPGSALPTDNSEITVKVRVTNTGDRPGKDVVQLYYTPPYTRGGIEKSAINLVAFAKTAELKPANMTENGIPESQVVELTFTPYDMASYDCYDRNYNRNVGYELDAGEYIMRLSNTAHDLDDCEGAQWSYNLAANYKFRNDPVTGNRVTNRFTNYDTVYKNESGEFVTQRINAYSNCAIDGSDADQPDTMYLTRSDFAGTFPKVTEQKKSGEAINAASSYIAEPSDPGDVVRKDPVDNGLRLVTDENGGSMSYSELNSGTVQYKYNDELMLELGLDYDSPTWDTLLAQLSDNDIYTLVSKGNYGNAAIESIGKPILYDSDGPAGLNRQTISSGVDRTEWTMYVMPNVLAQSWNTTLSYSFGLSVGKEANLTGNKGWYAPGANLQRSFFGGRNSEYYSEDPLLSGIMTAESCRGSINNGQYVYLKHFAANESETNRIGLYTWLTEQSLRELYLRPFEIGVKRGGAKGIMAAFNRIGAVWAGGNRAMTQEILRDEWGFRGSVVTDSYQTRYNPIKQAVIGGVDLMLGVCNESIDMSDPALYAEMRESAKNIIYAWCNAYATAKTHDPSEDRFTASVDRVVTVPKPFPYWFVGLVAINVVVIAGIIVGTFFLFKPKKKRKNEEAAAVSGDPNGNTVPNAGNIAPVNADEASAAVNADSAAMIAPEPAVSATAVAAGESADGIPSGETLSFADAFEQLPEDAKTRFRQVEKYALNISGAEEKATGTGVTVKIGSKRLVRLKVRRGKPVALFDMENDELRSYRKESGIKFPHAETMITLDKDDSVTAACRMINIAAERVQREKEQAAERRREARRNHRDTSGDGEDE